MEFDFFNIAAPALVVIVVVLVLEEWAYFKARTKLQRAFITGVAVFMLVLILSLVPVPGL